MLYSLPDFWLYEWGNSGWSWEAGGKKEKEKKKKNKAESVGGWLEA